MLRRLFAVVCVLHLAGGFADARPFSDKQIKATATWLSDAYRQDRPLELLERLVPLVSRGEEQDLAKIDAIMSADGLPTTIAMLAESRQFLTRQGLARDLPKPGRREILAVLPHFLQVVRDARDEQQNSAIMADPLSQPKTLDQFETELSEANVLFNRLQGAIEIATYADTLLKGIRRISESELTADQLEATKADFLEHVRALNAALNELAEREIELKVQRIAVTGRTVQESTDFKQRLTAIYLLDTDSRAIKTFLDERRKAGKPLLRENLREPMLLDRLEEETKERLSGSEKLLEQSRLLFEGLHWWYRGRYGMGGAGNGLLKSARAKGLFLPVSTPVPTEPNDSVSSSTPTYDRRHHYQWQWEHRSISRRVTSRKTSTRTKSVTSKTHLSTYY